MLGHGCDLQVAATRAATPCEGVTGPGHPLRWHRRNLQGIRSIWLSKSMSTGGPRQSQDLYGFVTCANLYLVLLCNLVWTCLPRVSGVLCRFGLHRMVPVTNIVHKCIESVRSLLYYKCNLKWRIRWQEFLKSSCETNTNVKVKYNCKPMQTLLLPWPIFVHQHLRALKRCHPCWAGHLG